MSTPNILPSHRWPHFIGLLAQEVTQASEAHPTVRIWKDTDLIALIRRVIATHKDSLKTTIPSGAEILQRLEISRWLRPIPVTENRTGRTFYLMDHEAPEEMLIAPEELLLATLPSGIISYFSALQHYHLTTQNAPFAHIGRLAKGHPPELPADAPPPPPGKNPLGTPLFNFHGLPCYETKRHLGLTPGISLRIQDPRTWYRITTLEQTLLDTLLQPQRCGGEAVIFEAWEKAAEHLDWARLASHLQAIGRTSLLQRTAVMLEITSTRIPATATSLLTLLHQARHPSAPGSSAPLPLLPGLPYHRPHPGWPITVP